MSNESPRPLGEGQGEAVLAGPGGLAKPVVFLDDGGVMSDNSMRSGQWQRLVGEFFAPRLGGAARAWMEANRIVAEALFAEFDAIVGDDLDYAAFERRYNRQWLAPMCRWVGVDTPPDDQIDQLCREATAYITSRVESPVRGSPEAVHELARQGYRLFTASGEDSISLEGYLGAMGIRHHFERLYGPDLVGVMKSGLWYYERVFQDSGVAPADALVVDDSPKAVAWARAVGARALHVGTDLARLADLPGVLSPAG